MGVKVHGVELSPPTRSVIYTLDLLGVKYDLCKVDVVKGEHKNPDNVKLNPRQQIPFITDGDFCLGESLAIIIYLVEKYGGKSNFLCPQDRPETYARIIQLMYFAVSDLWPKFFDVVVSYFKQNVFIRQNVFNFQPGFVFHRVPVDPEREKLVTEAFQVIENCLDKSDFVAGTRSPTLADLLIFPMYTQFLTTGLFSAKQLPNMTKWTQLMMRSVPDSSVERTGLLQFTEFVDATWKVTGGDKIENAF